MLCARLLQLSRFLKFIHVVTIVRSAFHLISKWRSPWYEFPMICLLIVLLTWTFLRFVPMVNTAVPNISVHVLVRTCFQTREWNSWTAGQIYFQLYMKLSTCYPKCFGPFCIPISTVEESQFLPVLANPGWNQDLHLHPSKNQ